METGRNAPTGISEYISSFPPEIRAILERIRRTVHRVAPDAEEFISYRMPAFRLDGVLLYFAAFRSHIGLYPPISGDARLEKALSPYAGPKGNLRFPYDRPIPYDLIERIVLLRAKQNAARAAARRAASRSVPRTQSRASAGRAEVPLARRPGRPKA